MATDIVTRFVRGKIIRGEIHRGERLPPERELVREIGVSRTTVRAGLQLLAAKGVLVIRHGAGTSSFEHQRNGVGTRLVLGMADDAPVKLSVLRVTNHDGRSRRLTLTSYVEWTLGALREHTKQRRGIVLPRDSRAMSKVGENVGKSDLQPGDLVFFNTLRRPFSHVGIYIGEQRFVHAPSRGGEVEVSNLHSRYWQTHYNGARRVNF